MSQLPDIHYSPGISGLKISGWPCGASASESIPTAQPTGQLHQTRRKARAILANAWLVSKLPWFLKALSRSLLAIQSSPSTVLSLWP